MSSVNRPLNDPSEVQPTAMQTSVTLRSPAAQQRGGPLDPTRHEVLVRRLAVGLAEAAVEVADRHQRLGRQGRDVERLGVVAVHPVAGAPEADEVVAVHPSTVPWGVAGVTREPLAGRSYTV